MIPTQPLSQHDSPDDSVLKATPCFKWFNGYADQFKHGDAHLCENVVLKQEHTLRVCREMDALCQGMHLSNRLCYLATLTALFHDVGRFEQFARYGTFVDRVSEDHANLSLSVLDEHHLLEHLPAHDRNLIRAAIRYHNRATLPDIDDPDMLMLSRLIRDADKLDIYRVVTEYYEQDEGEERNEAIGLGLPDHDSVSRGVIDDIMSDHIVDIEHVYTLNDFKLLQVGWVFDLNYEATRHQVLERGYLERLRTVLPDTPEMDRVFNHIYRSLGVGL